MKFIEKSTLLLFGLVPFVFSSCEEKRTEQEIVVKDKEGHKVSDYKVEVVEEIPFKDRFEKESSDMKIKLDSLKEKIALKGKKANKKTKALVESLDEERENFNTNLESERLEHNWNKFKARVDEAADSISKRM